MNTKKPLTPQAKVASRTAAAERRINIQPLFVYYDTQAEREYLRSHLWYTGASAEPYGYVATSMMYLPLAVAAMRSLRPKCASVIKRKRGGDWQLTTVWVGP